MQNTEATPAKKQWQKPNFYLLDSTNINAPGDKIQNAWYENTLIFDFIANGHRYGHNAASPGNLYIISNYGS